METLEGHRLIDAHNSLLEKRQEWWKLGNHDHRKTGIIIASKVETIPK